MRNKYTERHLQFLVKHSIGRTYTELSALFNKRFSCKITVSKCRRIFYTKKLPRDGIKLDWCYEPRPGSEKGWFKKGRIAPNKGVKGVCHPGSEKGHFRKGHRPHNAVEVGTEVIIDGYTKVKVGEPKAWKFKHVMIYEAAYGPVPEGHVVIFADQNKRNFKLDNLLLVSRGELAIMNNKKLIFCKKDLTKTGKTIASVLMLANKRRAKDG